jgi:hypothetical protein
MSHLWKHPCLKKECKGKHRIKECPNTSEELKQQLLDEFYANKRKNAGKTSAVVLQSADGTLDHSSAKGRWSATIGDNTRVVALGDIGADYSCIPRSLVPTIIQDGVRISESKLPSTVSLEGDVKNSHITAKSIVRADLTLQFNCGLILRQTEFLALDQEMSEILFGRPLLKAIGFDLEAHLETSLDVMNNSMFDTNQLSTVNTRSFGKAARSSYTDLQYNTADSDPVPPTETAGAAIGTDSASKIQDAIERMIASAKLNGMSSTRTRELLQDFREIFRIRLGSDPPAKIPPLKVQLKPHFAPVKDTQRRYAPAQRAFLSTTIKKLESLGAVRAILHHFGLHQHSLYQKQSRKDTGSQCTFVVQTHKQIQWLPVCHTWSRRSSPSRAADALQKSFFVIHTGTRPCRRVAGDFLNSNAGRHLHTDSTNTRQHRRRELLSRSNKTAFPRTSGAQTSSSTMARWLSRPRAN